MLVLVGWIVLWVTVVGIPFGLQCIQLATWAPLPFGKQIVVQESTVSCLATVMNIR